MSTSSPGSGPTTRPPSRSTPSTCPKPSCTRGPGSPESAASPSPPTARTRTRSSKPPKNPPPASPRPRRTRIAIVANVLSEKSRYRSRNAGGAERDFARGHRYDDGHLRAGDGDRRAPPEYRVSVVEDGVATLWPEIQRATLDIIGRAYGRVVTGKEVADQISSWQWCAPQVVAGPQCEPQGRRGLGPPGPRRAIRTGPAGRGPAMVRRAR